MKKTVGFKTTLLFEKYIQSYLIPKKPIFRGFIGGIPKNRILTTSNKDEKQHKTTKKRQFTPWIQNNTWFYRGDRYKINRLLKEKQTTN